MLDGAETIGRLLSRELGKPFAEGVLSEVLASADVVEHWCLQAESLLAPQPIAIDATSYPNKRGTIVREARGVVALITPWNYPIAIALRASHHALTCEGAKTSAGHNHEKASDMARRAAQWRMDPDFDQSGLAPPPFLQKELS